MGKKPTGEGKHLFLYLTGFIIAVHGLFACSDPEARYYHTRQSIQSYLKTEGELELVNARKLMADGYFHASLIKNEEVLAKYNTYLGDRALFQIGVIYAHPNNPNQSLQKAAEHFHAIIKDYPDSPLKSDAETWIFVLQKVKKNSVEIQKLIKTCDLKTSRLNQKINFLETRNNEKEKEIGNLKSNIKALQVEVDKLNSQIDRIKNVDIGIQEKKRKSINEKNTEKQE